MSKTIRFILVVSAEHRELYKTLHYNLLLHPSTLYAIHEVKLFTKIALSDGGLKKPAGKKPSGEKRTWQEIWVGTMAQALNSPSYEATCTCTQGTIYLETNALKNKVN